MRILIAGELNVDLVLQNYHSFPQLGQEVLVDDMSLTLGSASAICAAGLARLGSAVLFAGKVGCDAWGDLALDKLGGLGIDLRYVMRDSSIQTGLTVSLTSAKDRALITYLGSIAELRASDIQDAWFEGCRHLHVSSFYLQQGLRSGLKSLLARAHRAGLTTSIDPGFDPSGRWERDILDTLEEVDLFFPNEVELQAVGGSADPLAALHALDNGRTRTVAKLGAQGCMMLVNRSPLVIPAFRVQTVDTTGAGDSFNAGFLHAWLNGRDLADSARFGAACGALSTLGLGGTTAQPTESEAAAFLATHLEDEVRT
jgi:sugar/nucleoside kinase (ribokinase family)